MVIQLFNSSSVSGPETLVLPALRALSRESMVVNLEEGRLSTAGRGSPLAAFCAGLGLAFAPVPVSSRLDFSAVNALRALLEEKRPALVHAHDVKAALYLLLAVRGLSFRPVLYTTHHGVLGRPDLKSRCYEWLYRFVLLRFFDRVLAVSSEDRRTLEHAGQAAPRLRLHLNGCTRPLVPAGEREHKSSVARQNWGETCTSLLLGCVGRLSAEKDHARMLEVLALLKQNGSLEWKCLVFGVGALQASLEQRAAELGLQKNVRWMGYRAEVRNEFAGFDVLLSFSKAEGVPINLIEAGWAGTPVFATAVGGVRDLIPDSRFGELVPPGESVPETAERLQRFLAKKSERLACGLAFQGRVQAEFSGERWAADLEKMYGESLG